MTSEPQEEESPSRRPRWVYESGSDPDYRFSFANERTFLAWIRTSLGLLAGGVVVDTLDLSISSSWQRALAAALIALGLLCAGASWVRWAQAERAMRNGEALPSTSMTAGAGLTLALVAISVILLVLIF